MTLFRRRAIYRTFFIISLWTAALTSIAWAAEAESLDARVRRLAAEIAAQPGDHASLERFYSLLDLRKFTDVPQTIDALCSRLLVSPKSGFEVRQLAAWCVHEAAWTTGEPEAIAAALAPMGIVTRWLVAGPFDNEGGVGFDAVYPPEQGYDPEATMDGKERPVSWRSFPDVNRLTGYQDFADVYTSSTQSVAYAWGRVFAPRAMSAVLLIGSGGSLKAWLNGRLAAAWPEDRPARRWQSAYRVNLKKGVNDILVKVGGREADWGFRLALLDRAGRPLKGLAGLQDDAEAQRRASFPAGALAWALTGEKPAKPLLLTVERLAGRYDKQPDAAL
ncbi:MAG: hypothetical protein C4523_21390, partial [Myxococcales bacterium]